MSPLFCKEACEARRAGRFGRTLREQPMSNRVLARASAFAAHVLAWLLAFDACTHHPAMTDQLLVDQSDIHEKEEFVAGQKLAVVFVLRVMPNIIRAAVALELSCQPWQVSPSTSRYALHLVTQANDLLRLLQMAHHEMVHSEFPRPGQQVAIAHAVA